MKVEVFMPQSFSPQSILWKIFSRTTLIILVVVVLWGCWFTIPAGHRGVLLTMGKPSENIYGEGFHFKIPIVQRAVDMSVQTLKYEAEASSASKDLQIVNTKVAVNYHLDSARVVEVYRGLGSDFVERVIQPTLQEVVKASTAKFTAEELITKRPEAKTLVEDYLKERLNSRGIIIESVSITNFDFSQSFNQAIEAKVTAEQLKLKADMDLQRIQVEANQKIASAQAEAESLRIQKEQVSDQLIRLREIEVQRMAVDKWNGILPSVTGGAIPFINVGGTASG